MVKLYPKPPDIVRPSMYKFLPFLCAYLIKLINQLLLLTQIYNMNKP